MKDQMPWPPNPSDQDPENISYVEIFSSNFW